MSMLNEITIEEWRGADHTERRLPVSSAEDLDSVFRHLEPSASSQILLEAEGNTLIIGAWRGIYTTAVLLSNGEAYDLCSLRPQEGTLQFVEGGQSVEMQRRHSVTREQAIGVVMEFLTTGTVNVRQGWEKQR